MAATLHATMATTTGLGWLLDAEDGAMVTLVAADTRLVAHRAVLVDRSPVFDAMFRHDTLEASSGEIDIPDVEGPVLRQLLEYLYTLQVPQLPAMAPQLLAAADKYGMSALKEACEQQVAAQLCVETAAAAAVLAIRHSCNGLRQAAIDFIKSHLVEVIGTQGYADAVRMHPEDVVDLGRLLSETSTPATVDRATSPTPATQPHSDHRDCGQSPASAAPPMAIIHHGTPCDEAADTDVSSPPPACNATRPSAATLQHSDHSAGSQAHAAAAVAHQNPPRDDIIASRLRTPATVDRATSPTPATQPHSDHRDCGRSPASAAPPMVTTHNDSPHEEAAGTRMSSTPPTGRATRPSAGTPQHGDCNAGSQAHATAAADSQSPPRDDAIASRLCTPATVDRATSPTPATQAHSDHRDCSQSPASAAPPMVTIHHGSPHDEAADIHMSSSPPSGSATRPLPVTPQHGDHSAGSQAHATAAAVLQSTPRDDAIASRLCTPATVDWATSPTPATQPHSNHSDCGQSPATAALPTATTHHGSPHDEAADTSMSSPASAGSATCSSARTLPCSDQSTGSQGHASAAATPQRPPRDDTAASRLQRLSTLEKGRRLIEAARGGAAGQLEALLAAGADVAARDRGLWTYKTGLHWAAYKGHEEAARLLLAAGAAVDARDSGQETPLHYAAMEGHAAVVRLLLANGADHSASTVSGRTPLHLAVWWDHAPVVQLLLAANADHGARDWQGNTPLHVAAFCGHREAAAALLEAGADRAARDRWGDTPLDHARRNNRQQLVELLQARLRPGSWHGN